MQEIKNLKPNIVWFMIDSFRPFLLSPLEEGKEVTFIDELTKKGVFFEQCITAAPYTIASEHAIFTGLYPSVNKLDGWFKNTPDDLDKKVVTFTDILKAEGYFTAAFFPKRSRPFLPPYSFDHFQLVRSPDEFSIDAYLSASSPKFAIIILEEVHDTCCQNAGKFDKEKYYQSVKESAERVKYFYEKCCKEEDIVVITSDHGIRVIGEPTSDNHRDELVAGKFLTDKTTRTFFTVIAKDKIAPGARIKEQVRTIDIAPTILDLAGLPILKGQGISLLPYLKEEGKWPETPAFIVTGGMETSLWRPDTWGIRIPKWKFILTKIKKSFLKTIYRQELYDIEHDPAEIRNVIQDFPEVANSLFGKMKEMLLENPKTVEDYYRENGFDYQKYLKARIYPFRLKLELWLRTLFACKLFLHPKVQLGVARIKIRKFLKRKFGIKI